MTFGATTELTRYEEAVQWFLERVTVTPDELDKIGERARAQAFTVAGFEELKSVNAFYDATLHSLEKGESLGKFKKRIRESLGPDAFTPRLKSAYVTNMQSAYNAGRHDQMTQPSVVNYLTHWSHDSVFDSHTTDICKERDNLVVPASSPYWLTNHPPLHHHCRSGVRAYTERQAREKGITANPSPPTPPADGFGAIPSLKRPWEPDTSSSDPELQRLYARKQEQLTLPN